MTTASSFLAVVDELLQTLGEIRGGFVHPEPERRLREEEGADRHPSAGGVKGEDGSGRVPEHDRLAADRVDHGGEVVGLVFGR